MYTLMCLAPSPRTSARFMHIIACPHCCIELYCVQYLLLMNIWVVSTSLDILVDVFSTHMEVLLLGIYLGVKLLVHKVFVCSFKIEIAKCFSSHCLF